MAANARITLSLPPLSSAEPSSELISFADGETKSLSTITELEDNSMYRFIVQATTADEAANIAVAIVKKGTDTDDLVIEEAFEDSGLLTWEVDTANEVSATNDRTGIALDAKLTIIKVN